MFYYTVSFIVGALVGGMCVAIMAGGKIQQLEDKLNSKIEAWCSSDHCNLKMLLSEAHDTIAKNKKSIAALGGVVNSQVYKIARLKRDKPRSNWGIDPAR